MSCNNLNIQDIFKTAWKLCPGNDIWDFFTTFLAHIAKILKCPEFFYFLVWSIWRRFSRQTNVWNLPKKNNFRTKAMSESLHKKVGKSLINVLTYSRISPENVWKNDGQFQNFSGQFQTSITHSDMFICCRVILASFSWRICPKIILASFSWVYLL